MYTGIILHESLHLRSAIRRLVTPAQASTRAITVNQFPETLSQRYDQQRGFVANGLPMRGNVPCAHQHWPDGIATRQLAIPVFHDPSHHTQHRNHLRRAFCGFNRAP